MAVCPWLFIKITAAKTILEDMIVDEYITCNKLIKKKIMWSFTLAFMFTFVPFQSYVTLSSVNLK